MSSTPKPSRDDLLRRFGVAVPRLDPALSRREVLGLAGWSLAAVAAGCGTGNAPAPDAGAAVDAGVDGGCEPSACIAGANTLLVPLADHPALNQVGGSAVITDASYSDPNCNQNQLILIQPMAGQFIALSASCTHICCTVGYDASLSLLVCPCHGSRYSLTGAVVRGPAAVALPTYETCADACNVYVKLG